MIERPWVLGVLLLLACSSDSPKQARSPSSRGCDDEGASCECDDGSEGAYVCEDDALLCECAPPKKPDAGKRDASLAPDSGKKPDASKPNVVDASADSSDAGNDATPMTTGSPRIPSKPTTCPTLKTGTITVRGQQVQLWVGAKQAGKKGPILFYWHGTGSNSMEAQYGLGKGNQEILAEGGIIASFTTTTQSGTSTGNQVWYTGDFEMADDILACAIEQQDIDPHRVYTAGCSAGGLQAAAMVYGRSSYLAAAMPNSGGIIFPYKLEDPNHTPAVITTHGAMGKDVVGVDFATTSANMAKDIVAKGGFMVDCDHGGGHCASPTAVKNAQWDFLKAHPFGVTPEPYAAGLPSDFPTVCKIITK